MARHAEQKLVWQAREAEWERQQQYAQLREARVQFKQQADENLRLKRIREANSLTMPLGAATGGVVLTWGGSEVVQEVGKDIERLVRAAVQELSAAGLRATRVFKHPAWAAIFHVPATGNAELTAEQRQRLQGIGVSADLMGVRPGQDLQALAAAGQMADLDYRVKLEAHQGTTAIIVASTGEEISSRVPVRNAVFDPLTNTYRAEGSAVTDRDLVFTSDAVSAELPRPEIQSTSGLLSGESEAFAIPEGADSRINDCIVCIPGRAPVYFSFDVPPIGTGVVSGAGQVAVAGWWQASTQAGGAPIPAQAASTLRGREFTSFDGFERALWRAIGEEAAPGGDFSEVNQHRIANGLAPYAPKSSWVGQRREFEVRYLQSAALGSAPYDLDQLSLHSPASAFGVRPESRPFAPWLQLGEPISLEAAKSLAHASGGRRTWTPLAPPGIDLLGATDLPQSPVLPGTYPGAELDPYRPQVETLPGLDEGEIGSSIPGYGAGGDLPAPGLVFSEPLDVGPYNELGRNSMKDGLDIDHIVSKKALELFLRREFPRIDPREVAVALLKAPSMAIPTEVHREFSETYGGRNTKTKQIQDSMDLTAGVDRNVDALKPGLLEYGLKESDIEAARQKLHDLFKTQGWVK
ncbi:S-type pyocin domain-containing protein [Pseudomonas sp. zfem002]|uniref:S-type pyocin domain-containing protein n=1 Tax=Pseudomonas sp. zfem002 TaxID=3078197 RepID=UPI002929FF31|nr:S-type pyocin domain-containing protein [Pseudomonas sp. zfem002]MDU9392710.1 S-type pyocin domain-containing protein [Pseudomonas sp. zfem002]